MWNVRALGIFHGNLNGLSVILLRVGCDFVCDCCEFGFGTKVMWGLTSPVGLEGYVDSEGLSIGISIIYLFQSDAYGRFVRTVWHVIQMRLNLVLSNAADASVSIPTPLVMSGFR